MCWYIDFDPYQGLHTFACLIRVVFTASRGPSSKQPGVHVPTVLTIDIIVSFSFVFGSNIAPDFVEPPFSQLLLSRH
jgi:hypothetical protein